VGLQPPECTLHKACGIYVVIEHNGDVYACDFFVEPDWKLGNIMDDKLINLLNSDKQNVFGQMKANVPASCVNCRWLTLCRGGCTKDRIRDPRDKKMSHFCRSYQQFFEYTHEKFQKMAEDWKTQQNENI
jgi:uncharacterized protein